MYLNESDKNILHRDSGIRLRVQMRLEIIYYRLKPN